MNGITHIVITDIEVNKTINGSEQLELKAYMHGDELASLPEVMEFTEIVRHVDDGLILKTNTTTVTLGKNIYKLSELYDNIEIRDYKKLDKLVKELDFLETVSNLKGTI